jgi:hypothetical protein
MSGCQVFILCWVCYCAGFFTTVLMNMARDGERRDD